MSKKRQSSRHGNDESDESGTLYTINLGKIKKRSVNLNIRSDINRNLTQAETWRIKKETTKRPSVQLASAHVDIVDTINIIETFDRPKKKYAKKNVYTQAGKYAHGHEDKPGKRIPKAGVYAEAGVGRARAEASIFEAEAKGPNASAGAEVSLVGLGAMARAEIASASAKAGPVGVKVGLGVDTGASIGLGGVEAKFLGTGISLGPKTSVSVLGSEASCSVM
ncbi:uncharacterized protein LOC127173091 isoform X2 [Labeo rohita]|uniref:uncharacterized protein LOC127173091 isoform X2 n=1 Tax=Labeo rohita TaxID=84645 RepID=UPI0021E1CE0C|nr:uncharacterized protein LOC127173091 isoform X2 [Labeo rohita]